MYSREEQANIAFLKKKKKKKKKKKEKKKKKNVRKFSESFMNTCRCQQPHVIYWKYDQGPIKKGNQLPEGNAC